MSYSADFCTKSEIVPCKNLAPENITLVALDIGYSAVKGFSAINRFCFPSYVRQEKTAMIGAPRATDMYYRDEDGTVYSVGAMAQDSLSAWDTNDDSNTMYGRNRYDTPTFLILARVGLAMGLHKMTTPDKPLFLQTGLPPAYRKADTPILVDALSGRHQFDVKVGNGPWRHYDFDLDASRISVIDQPVGSIYSATKKSDGTSVLCDNGKTYIDHRILVLDGGFGTLDVFSVANRHIDSYNTFNDLGMKAILEGVSKDIFQMYGKEVYAHTMQPFLASGTIAILDRKTRATRQVDITDILVKNVKKVFEQAIVKIEAAYHNLEDYDYLLVTGGTGAAWFDMLEKRYRNMTTLSIISGNQNEDMPPIYNNVRGYYLFRAVMSK